MHCRDIVLMSAPTGLLRRGWKMAAAESTSDTQIVTPLPSWFLVAFSAPTIELRYWLFVQLQSTCQRVWKKWELSPSSLTPCQPFKPSTQLIQTRWSRACTPPLPSWQLSFQYSSSGCLLMWDWQETEQQTDLHNSAVRLCRHRILSPTERPRHFSTFDTMETGRKKTVDTRHTLTQFGDWSGPRSPLSSACAQDTVVWVSVWRGLAIQTLPCVSADKLTKPETTSFSPAQNMPRDVS